MILYLAAQIWKTEPITVHSPSYCPQPPHYRYFVQCNHIDTEDQPQVNV